MSCIYNVLNQCNRIFGSSQCSLEVTFVVNYKLCLFCLENTEALLVAIKETLISVNADKTEYVFVSLEENAGRNYNTKMGNKFFKIMAEF
jgi:hypothetical protein